MTKCKNKGSCRLMTLKMKWKKRYMKARRRARRASLRQQKVISEDECDFDFDNSSRALCSTSEDDSDGPQGSI